MSILTSEIQDLREVASALDATRKKAITDVNTDHGSESSHMRATLSNVIIMLADPCAGETTEQLESVIATLAVQHPSRFFILRCCSESTTSISAEVRSRCVLAESGHGICTEEIVFSIPKEEAEVVPNLLLSHLVPDIDTVLLLQNDPTDYHQLGFGGLLSSVSAIVDLLLYDSSAFARYDTGIDEVLALLEQAPASGFVGATARDVAWLRIKRWQDLLAEHFGSQQFVAQPGAVASVTIEQMCTGQPTTICSEAVLLLSWFLESLRWSFVGVDVGADGMCVVNCRAPDGSARTIEIILSTEPTEPTQWSGSSIKRIAVSAGAGSGTMVVSITRLLETALAEVAVSVSATGSGSDSSCDYSVRRVPFCVPAYEQLISSRIVAQRVHKQRERCVLLGREIAERVATIDAR